jgi:hypothetical protein
LFKVRNNEKPQIMVFHLRSLPVFRSPIICIILSYLSQISRDAQLQNITRTVCFSKWPVIFIKNDSLQGRLEALMDLVNGDDPIDSAVVVYLLGNTLISLQGQHFPEVHNASMVFKIPVNDKQRTTTYIIIHE